MKSNPLYKNPVVKRINNRREWGGLSPIKERSELYALAREIIEGHRAFEKAGAHPDVFETTRKQYTEVREAILAVGGDINDFPRRLRVRVWRNAA